MIDWASSMQQTYEYYVVDPETWTDKYRIEAVKRCSVTRDGESETLGSATLDVNESIGECYVRVYMIAIQNGVRYKEPISTMLIQTPTIEFDGKVRGVSLDAYTPLLELKETPPPLGYTIPEGTNILDEAYRLTREHLRAPVVKAESAKKLEKAFVANADDTWFSFIRDLLECAKYEFSIDEMGRILFAPRQVLDELQPRLTYGTGEMSILKPEITIDNDLYGIPNVVEVVYSTNTSVITSIAKNTDPNSPVSIQNRGREIVHRITDPNLLGAVGQLQVDEYASNALKSLSSIVCKISYEHGYCETRLGDCVRINYPKAGLNGVNAKVISQIIECDSGCLVKEQAVFNSNLWG